ncbi:MAG: AzlC family ABC transporter permease [Rhodospirillales bacterium]|nr:AzlC family ABC transporter permease [Rhodospirillales bacterium]MDE2199618.1 AzlC family ABC transporter permease [Rhodospirillales bacterium]
MTFTGAGIRRGMRDCIPLLIGVTPFGIVCGIVAQGTGLSWLESSLLSGLCYAGSAQLVALANWGHPAGVVAASFTAFVVNLRLALMGPVLSPWLDRLRGWRLWGSLFVMADQNWAQAVRDMNAGGRDAGVLFGSGAIMWVMWVITSAVGYTLGSIVRPPPGHPLFFAALAVFVSMLASMWRGRGDVMPWLVAAIAASLVARLLPGTSWYIVAGALAGSLAGGLRDHYKT